MILFASLSRPGPGSLLPFDALSPSLQLSFSLVNPSKLQQYSSSSQGGHQKSGKFPELETYFYFSKKKHACPKLNPGPTVFAASATPFELRRHLSCLIQQRYLRADKDGCPREEMQDHTQAKPMTPLPKVADFTISILFSHTFFLLETERPHENTRTTQSHQTSEQTTGGIHKKLAPRVFPAAETPPSPPSPPCLVRGDPFRTGPTQAWREKMILPQGEVVAHCLAFFDGDGSTRRGVLRIRAEPSKRGSGDSTSPRKGLGTTRPVCFLWDEPPPPKASSGDRPTSFLDRQHKSSSCGVPSRAFPCMHPPPPPHVPTPASECRPSLRSQDRYKPVPTSTKAVRKEPAESFTRPASAAEATLPRGHPSP